MPTRSRLAVKSSHSSPACHISTSADQVAASVGTWKPSDAQTVDASTQSPSRLAAPAAESDHRSRAGMSPRRRPTADWREPRVAVVVAGGTPSSPFGGRVGAGASMSVSVIAISTVLPLDPVGGEAGVEEAFERRFRSEEHTSELQSLMRISYAVFCLKKKHKQ